MKTFKRLNELVANLKTEVPDFSNENVIEVI
jgi:hypothetical protein